MKIHRIQLPSTNVQRSPLLILILSIIQFIMLVVELFKKKTIVLITAIIFVGIAYAHEYADKHQTIRRLNRKKEVARRTIHRMDNDKDDVEFWTRLMKVGGSMPDGGVSHTLNSNCDCVPHKQIKCIS